MKKFQILCEKLVICFPNLNFSNIIYTIFNICDCFHWIERQIFFFLSLYKVGKLFYINFCDCYFCVSFFSLSFMIIIIIIITKGWKLNQTTICKRKEKFLKTSRLRVRSHSFIHSFSHNPHKLYNTYSINICFHYMWLYANMVSLSISLFLFHRWLLNTQLTFTRAYRYCYNNNNKNTHF